MVEKEREMGFGSSNRSIEQGANSRTSEPKRAIPPTFDVPANGPESADENEDLGNGHLSRYLELGDGADLAEAILHFQRALDLTPKSETDIIWSLRHRNLGYGYHYKYLDTADDADIKRTFQHYEQAIDLTPKSHYNYKNRLGDLGDGYEDRYLKGGSVDDLNKAIQYFIQAIDPTITNRDDPAYSHQKLGIGYRNRYLETGDEKDLKRAIRCLQQALELTSTEYSNRAGLLRDLAGVHQDQYLKTGARENLELAIQYFKQALDLTPPESPEWPDRLQNLGVAYRNNYTDTGARVYLDQALQYLEKALQLTSAGHPGQPQRLQDLANGYLDRHYITHVSEDLDHAIAYLEQALNLTQPEHLDYSSRIEDLGNGYQRRYLETGSKEDLDRAIDNLQRALALLTSSNPLDKASGLTGLGNALRDRFQEIGAKSDADQSIQYLHQAMDITPAGHPARANRIGYLGNSYLTRYRLLGTERDLDQAIQNFRNALDISDLNHPDSAIILQNLGSGLQDRYMLKRAREDLVQAIQLFQKAVDLTPNHPDLAAHVHCLGSGYITRYLDEKGMEDLDRAIKYFQHALDLTPINHPNRALHLRDLAFAYEDKYLETGSNAARSHALENFEQAFKHDSSSIQDRLKAGIAVVVRYAESSDWKQAYDVASKTVPLVKLMTPRFLENSDKNKLLARALNFAPIAAAVALKANKPPYEAVRLVETGRGIIVGSLNEIRSDISELQEKYPHQAEKFLYLRDKLDTPTTSISAEIRYKSGQKLEQVVQEIRGLSGFERFLEFPSETDLKTVAKHGPIAIINVSDYGCDALIIEETQIQALQLPDLCISDIRNYAKSNLAKLEVLRWLWRTVASPVLNALKFQVLNPLRFQPSAGCPWPHIWWIPTGPLSGFPIHAAGDYGENPLDSVLERAISSYGISVNSIIEGHNQHRQPELTLNSDKVVLVAMPKTPGMADLCFASEEVDRIGALCADMKFQVNRPLAVFRDVLCALEDCSIFHFAGHGLTNVNDPFQSQLILEDWSKDPLTVAKLFETNLKRHKPFLAFLSACGTGRIEYEDFFDEALHLISGCQVAGFQHVIGTLWEVNDRSCVKMAVETYNVMRKWNMSHESVSRGLHQASRCLRRQWMDENSEKRSLRDGAKVRIRTGNRPLQYS